jgi:hypothetical protein
MRFLPDPRRPYPLLNADLLRLGALWASEPQTLPLRTMALPPRYIVVFRHGHGASVMDPNDKEVYLPGR